MVAEAKEQVQDIVAEVHAESRTGEVRGRRRPPISRARDVGTTIGGLLIYES